MIGPTVAMAGQTRTELSETLRSLSSEIEQAIATRVRSISDLGEIDDPSYAAGLRDAITASVDFCIAGIESTTDTRPPVPPAFLSQVERAVRHQISLETILRRCAAGSTIFLEFLAAGTRAGSDLSESQLQILFLGQSMLSDRLMASASDHYSACVDIRYPRASDRDRLNKAERLLQGDPLDPQQLAASYSFSGEHLGAIATGGDADSACRELATTLGVQSLLIRQDTATTWAWFGSPTRIDATAVERMARRVTDRHDCLLTLGEPASGLTGWRRTHRQALAVFPIALRLRQPLTCYGDVVSLTAVYHHDLHAASLREIYLAPLSAESDGGRVAKETLRAFFATGRMASSAAALLGVHRNTVAGRLRAVEHRLGRTIDSCAADLETALRLEELDAAWGGPDK